MANSKEKNERNGICHRPSLRRYVRGAENRQPRQFTERGGGRHSNAFTPLCGERVCLHAPARGRGTATRICLPQGAAGKVSLFAGRQGVPCAVRVWIRFGGGSAGTIKESHEGRISARGRRVPRLSSRRRVRLSARPRRLCSLRRVEGVRKCGRSGAHVRAVPSLQRLYLPAHGQGAVAHTDF